MRSLSLLFAVTAVTALSGCEPSTKPTIAFPLTAAPTPGEAPLFLLPEGSAAAGTPVALRIVTGALATPQPVATDLLQASDAGIARLGGSQQNGLAPLAAADGAARFDHAFAHGGDALLGVELRTTDGTWHSCKHLRFVHQGGLQRPVSSAALAARIGHGLELVPMVDPLPLQPGDLLPVRVLRAGPAVEGARVQIQHASLAQPLAAVADRGGIARIAIQGRGLHLLTVTHTEAGQTRHASLTFAVEGVR